MSNFQPEAATPREGGLFDPPADATESSPTAAANAPTPTPRNTTRGGGASPRIGAASAEFAEASSAGRSDEDSTSTGAVPAKEEGRGALAEQTASPDAAARLASIDESLREIRGLVESRVREEQHENYSPFSVAAGAAQALAAGLLIWAFAELAFGRLYADVLMKLAFALVIQTIALTAIVAGRSASGR
ncbi:MAG: hypothetical protein SF069_02245 [Phycisphaerae bacterium]|nr:hypothetical protein [Phycisphaerae bacterium]